MVLPETVTYLDTLLVGLKESGVGCHWEGEFAGAFAYADDIVLLAPSLSALRSMLSRVRILPILVALGSIHQKHNLLSSPCMLIAGTQLPLLNEVVHLGHVLANNLFDDDIKRKCRDMVRKANTILATFPHLPPNVLTYLFRSLFVCLCMGALFGLFHPMLWGCWKWQVVTSHLEVTV